MFVRTDRHSRVSLAVGRGRSSGRQSGGAGVAVGRQAARPSGRPDEVRRPFPSSQGGFRRGVAGPAGGWGSRGCLGGARGGTGSTPHEHMYVRTRARPNIRTYVRRYVLRRSPSALWLQRFLSEGSVSSRRPAASLKPLRHGRSVVGQRLGGHAGCLGRGKWSCR